MALPNLLIVGTGKSGTSEFCDLLETHNDVFFPDHKEPNFFSYDQEYRKGLPFYEAKFQGANGCKVLAEKSWSYSVKNVYPDAVGRIKKHIDADKTKIIYMVRNPLERLSSLYLEMRTSGRPSISRDINTAVFENLIFIDSSRYFTQINEYRQHYGDQNIKVIFFETYINNRMSMLENACEFLQIDPNGCSLDPSARRNKSIGKREDGKLLDRLRLVPFFSQARDRMPQEIRSTLRGVLKTEVVEKPKLNASNQKKFIDEIRTDVKQFLAYCKETDCTFGKENICEWQLPD